MTKLHSTLSTSPDPSLLEMRILANHGADPRFAFLRKGGKWRDVWERIRKGERGTEKEVEETKGGLGLVAYGSDSDDEGSDEEETKEEEPVAEPEIEEPPLPVEEASLPTSVVEESEEDRAKKEAKAAKAREWARKRKEAREAASQAG
jgi:hypothetical protein